VDITAVSRGDDPALVAGDKLHPSGKQYTEWVRLIAPVAREALAR
jgi:lysophospholipase L1-like esterase